MKAPSQTPREDNTINAYITVNTIEEALSTVDAWKWQIVMWELTPKSK